MHLLDTAILWELRGARAGRCDARVAAWTGGRPRTELFISALSIAELGAAAAQVARSDKAGSAAIRRWAEARVSAAFEGRVLPIDGAIAARAGALGYADMRDALIAATALEHGLTLVTRRTPAFKLGKVRTFDPWGFHPDAVEVGTDWREATRPGPQWLKSLFVRG
jgi:predicted nucleic acid-binding protein